MGEDTSIADRPRDGLAILTEGVEALAELGGEDAYELLQEVARVAAGSDAAHSGLGRNQAMVDTVGVLLAAHMRASARRRVEGRRTQLRRAVAEVVEAAMRDRDVDRVLSAAVRVLVRATGCQGASIRAFDDEESAPTALRHSASYPSRIDDLLTAEVVEAASRAARVCWERQDASLLHVDEPDTEPLTTAEERDFALDFMARAGSREMLLAPMGADGVCLGWIALSRSEVHEPFGADDVDAVLAIGREVGNAVRHARAFERQQELIEQLREVSDHKSRFTATLAHQLRNPLTGASLHLDELRELHPPGGDDPTAAALAAVERSVRTIGSTVESLLALARLEGPERPPAAGVVELDRVVADWLARDDAGPRSSGVVVDVTAVEPGVCAVGEAAELEMVVDNLLGNAVKYTPAGGAVRLALTRVGDEVVLVCADDGIGMDAHDLALMFTPFHRARDAQSRRIPGTGLGLAIVQAAVDRHGGSITATSQPGAGTRVEVRLPAAG